MTEWLPRDCVHTTLSFVIEGATRLHVGFYGNNIMTTYHYTVTFRSSWPAPSSRLTNFVPVYYNKIVAAQKKILARKLLKPTTRRLSIHSFIVCLVFSNVYVSVWLLTRTKAQLSNQTRVTDAEPMAELGDEGLQVLSSLLWCMNMSEEIPQSIWEELVTEIVEGHQLIQDIPPAHTHTDKWQIHEEKVKLLHTSLTILLWRPSVAILGLCVYVLTSHLDKS